MTLIIGTDINLISISKVPVEVITDYKYDKNVCPHIS